MCVHEFLHVRICVSDALICAFVRVRILLYVWFLDCQLFVLYVVRVRFVPGGRFIRSHGPFFWSVLARPLYYIFLHLSLFRFYVGVAQQVTTSAESTTGDAPMTFLSPVLACVATSA